MNTSARGVSQPELRLLIKNCESAIKSVQALEDAARTMRARNWAAYVSERASEAWHNLFTTLATPTPRELPPRVRAIIGFSTPMKDAPEELRGARDRALAALESLAISDTQIIVPMIGDDGYLRPELIRPLGAIMTNVARDLN
jgi:hypothetical protein